MDINVKVSLDNQALSVMTQLVAAIAATTGNAGAIAEASTAAKATGKTGKVDNGPFYWRDGEDQVGEAESLEEYEALKAEDDSIIRIPDTVYKKAVKDAAAAEAAEAAAKKTAAKKPAAKKPAAKKAETEEAEHTLDDLVACFSGYIPTTLTGDEREERRGFVKALLQRFGAAKVSAIAPEQYGLAIAAVERKLAGEEIDPTEADWDAFYTDGGDDLL